MNLAHRYQQCKLHGSRSPYVICIITSVCHVLCCATIYLRTLRYLQIRTLMLSAPGVTSGIFWLSRLKEETVNLFFFQMWTRLFGIVRSFAFFSYDLLGLIPVSTMSVYWFYICYRSSHVAVNPVTFFLFNLTFAVGAVAQKPLLCDRVKPHANPFHQKKRLISTLLFRGKGEPAFFLSPRLAISEVTGNSCQHELPVLPAPSTVSRLQAGELCSSVDHVTAW